MNICFVRHEAFPLFEPSETGGIGGAEVRSFTFARALAAREGTNVSFVVQSDFARASRRYGNVVVHFDPARRWPHTRELLGRPSGFWLLPAATGYKVVRSIQRTVGGFSQETMRTCARIDADVYCCFGAGIAAANVTRAARLLGERSIVFLIHDDDLTERSKFAVYSPKYRRAIARARDECLATADEIVVQNAYQQQQLLHRFGRRSVLIRNPIDTRRREFASRPIAERFVLWVGRGETFHKRADRCLDLARRSPTIRFVMVMNPADPREYRNLVDGAPGNVTIIPRVPFAEIESYYSTAAAFVSTSDSEGFPNAFLQAAKYGVPIVSYVVDPDGMLTEHGCGLSARGNMDDMVAMLNQVWQGDATTDEIAQAGPRYVAAYHALDDRVAELESLIRNLAPRRVLAAPTRRFQPTRAIRRQRAAA